ncbi:hypothetical protein [Azospirillum aestuarii]
MKFLQFSGLSRLDLDVFGRLHPAERAWIEDTLKDILRRMGLRSIPID